MRQTNRALLSVQVDQRTGQLIVMSAIDNLVKGAAGQAVHCMNLRFGFDETAGFLTCVHAPSAAVGGLL